MDNYNGIIKMNREELAALLDEIYITGLNNGMYAALLTDQDKQMAVLGESPFNESWLASDAEPAVLSGCFAVKMAKTIKIPDEEYVLKANAKSVLRLAGIEANNNETE